jgi:hypothetical protein
MEKRKREERSDQKEIRVAFRFIVSNVIVIVDIDPPHYKTKKKSY